MGVRIIQSGLLAVIVLIAGSASCADASLNIVVKKSRNKICHERGTPGYEQTVHFKSFKSLAACLKSGGRLPKSSTLRKPVFDPSKPAHAGDDGVLFGPLVKVVDGDTFDVKIQGVVLRFRLSGVDAPESDQPFGDAAQRELAVLIADQPCVLVYEEGDMYGRLVVHLWIGDTYVNAEMVKRGMAWFDSASAPNDLLFADEEGAREAKRGLWAPRSEKPIAPWDWRKEPR